jgi:hypothetical protein
MSIFALNLVPSTASCSSNGLLRYGSINSSVCGRNTSRGPEDDWMYHNGMPSNTDSMQNTIYEMLRLMFWYCFHHFDELFETGNICCITSSTRGTDQQQNSLPDSPFLCSAGETVIMSPSRDVHPTFWSQQS